MSDDKRFEATPSRLARAKREGDVARSQDLGAVAAFAGAALALFGVLPWLTAAARAAFAAAVSQSAVLGHASALHADAFGGSAGGRSAGALPSWTSSPWPYAVSATSIGAVFICALGGGLGAAYLQTRTFVFRWPQPKFAKLDPFKGCRRVFGRDAIVGATKASFVSGAVAFALIPAVRSSFAPALGASPSGLALLALRAVQSALGSAVAVAFAFACADALLEAKKWKRRLRMSFDELRRDHKASDGDPLLRGRRRQRHRALIRGAVARVRDAAFVISNPTHVAIALEYAPPEVCVPRVLVRAMDAGAHEVRRLARGFGVPIVENVALARALLATTDVGDFIPPDTYGAIAAIVAMLLRNNRVEAQWTGPAIPTPSAPTAAPRSVIGS
ncbi:MAG: EscU/YscU/HrcU family type III secretion system export apparatus switch protein [Candidatus Eremiobacteraeota bacterium]|nr:EscU/YscU/HrcU family type III secretion system export apparatus switch protein [Candidatus Eremiobacteraeota bacterium]